LKTHNYRRLTALPAAEPLGGTPDRQHGLVERAADLHQRQRHDAMAAAACEADEPALAVAELGSRAWG